MSVAGVVEICTDLQPVVIRSTIEQGIVLRAVNRVVAACCSEPVLSITAINRIRQSPASENILSAPPHKGGRPGRADFKNKSLTLISEVHNQSARRDLHIFDIGDLLITGIIKISTDLQPIGVGSAIQQSIVFSTYQRVVSGPSRDEVCAKPGIHRIGSRAAKE